MLPYSRRNLNDNCYNSELIKAVNSVITLMVLDLPFGCSATSM
jgi:hypothetical protein